MLSASPHATPSFARRRNRRFVPRVSVGPAAVVRIKDDSGPSTAQLRDLSPWGLGLRRSPGPSPSVGSRVQIAFGLDRWAICRTAEVRRNQGDTLGLALADPLPAGLRSRLMEMRIPRLASSTAGDPGHLERGPANPFDRVERAWLDAQGSIVGHLRVSRWTPTTWFADRIAALAHHPDGPICARDLYRMASTTALYGGGDAHLVALFPPSDPARDLTEGFAVWLDEPDRAATLHLDRYPLVGASDGLWTLTPVPPRAALGALSTFLPGIVRRALGWHDEPRAIDGRIFEVRTHRCEGYVALDSTRATTGEPAAELIWLVPHPEGDFSTLLAGARQAAIRCGMRPAAFMPADPRCRALATVATIDTVGLMVWSSDGLRDYDGYLDTMQVRLEPSAQPCHHATT